MKLIHQVTAKRYDFYNISEEESAVENERKNTHKDEIDQKNKDKELELREKADNFVNIDKKQSEDKHDSFERQKETKSKNKSQILFKFAKFCPDEGSAFIAVDDDNQIQIFMTPPQQEEESNERKEIECDEEIAKEDKEDKCFVLDDMLLEDDMQPYINSKQSSSVLDFEFYPLMSWSEYSTCCFLTSQKYIPIHLRSMYDCSIYSSYFPLNNVDELSPVYSLAFNPQGETFYAGSKNSVKIFNVYRPGKHIYDNVLCTRRRNAFNRDNQRGIISTIAISKSDSKWSNTYACGSYSKNIYIYDMKSNKYVVHLHEDDYPRSSYSLWGGVTHLEWISAASGSNLLVSGHRDDTCMRVWDLRFCKNVFLKIHRVTDTHQKYTFGVRNNLLVTGWRLQLFLFQWQKSLPSFPKLRLCDSDGCTIFYDLEKNKERKFHTKRTKMPLISAVFHPVHPVVLSTFGSRQFDLFDSISLSQDDKIEKNECFEEDNNEELKENRRNGVQEKEGISANHFKKESAFQNEENGLEKKQKSFIQCWRYYQDLLF